MIVFVIVICQRLELSQNIMIPFIESLEDISSSVIDLNNGIWHKTMADQYVHFSERKFSAFLFFLFSCLWL